VGSGAVFDHFAESGTPTATGPVFDHLVAYFRQAVSNQAGVKFTGAVASPQTVSNEAGAIYTGALANTSTLSNKGSKSGIEFPPSGANSHAHSHGVGSLPEGSYSEPHDNSVSFVPGLSFSNPSLHGVNVLPGHTYSAPFEHENESYPALSQSSILGLLTESLPGSSQGTIFSHITEAYFVAIRGKQIATGANGIVTANLADGTLSADAAGRAKFASSFFDSATVTAKFASNSIALDRLAEAVLQADGGQALTANLPAGGFTLTGLGAPSGAGDAATKSYVDGLVSGLQWREPACALELVGNDTVSNLNTAASGFTGADTGRAYVCTDAGTLTLGSVSVVAGSLVEFDGAAWVELVAGSGGFVPDGTRAIASTSFTLASPYTDTTHDGMILSFDGSTLTGVDTGEATDGSAVLIECDGGVYENQGYVFDGSVPTGSWTQFTGAGQVNAGTGLSKAGNTLNVGDINRGVQVNADDLEIDGSEIAGNGLVEASNSWQLDVAPAQLISGGNAEVNGDLLDVDGITYNNVTPVTAAAGSQVNPATLVDHLAAHLIGIDNALGAAGGTPRQEAVTTQNITGTDTAITDTLNNTPTADLAVKLFLNGVLLSQGAGLDYTISGSTLTWLASSGTAPDLDTSDVLIAVYES